MMSIGTTKMGMEMEVTIQEMAVEGCCTLLVGCTYKEFLNCQPLKFKGIEGAVGLAHWFEKMEFVFHISNCAVECQLKYATYTLLGGALTWWNSHVRIVGDDAAYEMSWKSLMKMMTEEFECGKQGHYRSECPKLKNQNRGNQAEISEARGRVYALRGGEADQDPNNIVVDPFEYRSYNLVKGCS
ncbi:putative reverse transcriptase domain-containing protein [Tanacetum coccineum]